MKTGLIVTAVAVTLAAGTVFAVAAPGLGDCDANSGWGKGALHRGVHAKTPEDAKHRQQRMLDRLEQQLSLSESQRLQVGELLAKRAGQLPDRRAQMQQLRTQMQGLDPAAADYLDQVAALAEQQAARMSQQMLERAEQHAQLFALLTPEQQQAFRKMEPQRGDRQGRHQGPW